MAARKATEILIRRSEQRGDDRAESGQRERQSRRDYFLHLLHLLWNQSPAGPGGFNNETIDEAFAAAQYAGGIEIAKAVSGTMARAASGTDDLAALVREREDLTGRWHKLDSDLLKAVSLTPDQRDATAEAGLRKERAEETDIPQPETNDPAEHKPRQGGAAPARRRTADRTARSTRPPGSDAAPC